MNDKFYSNTEFSKLRERINKEIKRRGGFRWNNPISEPKIGIDKQSPLAKDTHVPIDDNTYTINNPSTGSIEPTRNIDYPANGNNPAGKDPEYYSNIPNNSAAAFTEDEIKNYLVGLSKIHDINLFYGRDEEAGLAFRDPKAIEEILNRAEQDLLNIEAGAAAIFNIENGNLILDYEDQDIGLSPVVNMDNNGNVFVENNNDEFSMMANYRLEIENNDLVLTGDDSLSGTRVDPNGLIAYKKNPNYPTYDKEGLYKLEDGKFKMPSGEYNGEEIDERGLGPHNFFDDYGAEPGDDDFHPYNKAKTPVTERVVKWQNNDRSENKEVRIQGGINASTYGANPRNPNIGEEYESVQVYAGTPGTCQNQCTGLCFTTCDSQCSESCDMTCFSRCGNRCTATCGNQCTGCSSQCYTTCRTKCENASGYSCVNAGAQSIKITTTGGTNGEIAKTTITATSYSCTGCQYSCQFYPNKKTSCWDSGCMGRCFTSCNSGCATSCVGGCIGNSNENNGNYKIGKGTGCSSGCTVNCIGICQGTCEGYCNTTCFHGCKQSCEDNCMWRCETTCGQACENGCRNWCTGCSETCSGGCKLQTDMVACTGCGTKGGCTSTCQHNCNRNCIGEGCRSICGIDTAGACSANCRLSCMGASCTSKCNDACSSQCNTCVNTCGFQCGACSTECSASCSEECNTYCTQSCSNNCEVGCVSSCSSECGGCSDLCYSCVGMCIGICMIRCEGNCTNCSNNCSYWCDNSCNQKCISNCDNTCNSNCSNSCISFVSSTTTEVSSTPKNPDYPKPNNREEEKESFVIIRKDDNNG